MTNKMGRNVCHALYKYRMIRMDETETRTLNSKIGANRFDQIETE